VGDLAWAKKVTDLTMQAMRVETFDELLDVTPQQLNDAQDAVYQQYDPNWWCILYRPIVDDVTIKQDPRKSIREGQGRSIPLLTGSAADDVRHWLHWADWGTDSAWGPAATIPAVCADVRIGGGRWNLVYERMVANALTQTGRTPEQVEASYLAGHPGATPNDAFFFMLSDLTFRLPAIRMAENRLAAPGHKDNTWMFVDAWTSQLYLTPAGGGIGDPVNGMPAGAFHEVGLGFAFGLPEMWTYGPQMEFAPYAPGHAGEPGQGTIYPEMVWPSQLVLAYHETWMQFARTGDPNNPHIPHWPTYATKMRTALLFDAVPSVSDDWHGVDRLLWECVPGDPLYDCPADVAVP
jgi:para-nitrobenzyl esterase